VHRDLIHFQIRQTISQRRQHMLPSRGGVTGSNGQRTFGAIGRASNRSGAAPVHHAEVA
jgi:hypothetical protein